MFLKISLFIFCLLSYSFAQQAICPFAGNPLVPVGQNCTSATNPDPNFVNVTNTCAFLLSCANATRTCAIDTPQNTACSLASQCNYQYQLLLAGGGYFFGLETCNNGLCRYPRHAGQNCPNGNADCFSGNCTGGMCQSGASGGNCTANNQCNVLGNTQLYCNVTSGVCQARPTLGQACVTGTIPCDSRNKLTCVGGFCTTAATLGQPCFSVMNTTAPICDPLNYDVNGNGLYCDTFTSTCLRVGQKANGANCSNGYECGTGSACNATCQLNSGVGCQVGLTQLNCNVKFGGSPLNGFCNCGANINVAGTCAERAPPTPNNCLLQYQAVLQCLYQNCSTGGISEAPIAGLYPYDTDNCAGVNCVAASNALVCCFARALPGFVFPDKFPANTCPVPQPTIRPNPSARQSGLPPPRRSTATSLVMANNFIILLIIVFTLL